MTHRTVKLSAGVEIGGERVTEIRVREPKAGELRGLSVRAIVETEAAALIALLPRITEPALTPAQVEGLGAFDFGELGATVAGFFISAPTAGTAKEPKTSSGSPKA